MAVEPRLPGLVRVVLGWGTPHGGALNVMHVNKASTQSLQDAAESFLSVFRTFWEEGGTITERPRTYHHTDTRPNTLTLTDFSVLEGEQVSPLSGLPLLAGGGTNSLAGQTAAVISWRTAQTGKRRRGRTYMPGLATGALGTIGQLALAYRSAINTRLPAFIAGLDSAAIPLVVYSRVGAGTQTFVTSGTMDSRPDTMRSRGQ